MNASPIDLVLSKLEGVKRVSGGRFAKDGYMARCPAHDDRTASLSLSEGEGGRVLLKCQAGCQTPDIVAAISMTMADLFADKGNGKREIVATYDYTDEAGKLLFQVVRFAGKDFRQRRKVNGEWVWKLGDCRRVLYRLPDVIKAVEAGAIIRIVEGEKDADRLHDLGLPATCNPGGAGKWKSEYCENLRGAHVVIVADKDEPGRKHAFDVAAQLAGIAADLRIVEAAQGKDVSDHLAAGFTVSELVTCQALATAEVEDLVRGNGKGERGGNIVVPPEIAGDTTRFHLTELGNAERLAAQYRGSVYAVRTANELRGYDPSRGIYTTEHGLLVRYAADVVRGMYAEAGDGLSDRAGGLRKHAKASEAKRALDAMLELAKSLKVLEAEVGDFDADPELLNTVDGVVDLRTGELHRHAPKHRMTKITGCGYTPGAETPMWSAFLERIFAGDVELIAFMQRLFGYALTGYIGEQLFAIFFGGGANGKSVLVDSWHAAMGDYAGTAAMKTFLAHRAETVRTDLATFNGKRLVSTSESKPGQVIDAATVKVLTSKYVTCRFNYQRGEFTYTPQYLVILDTNFKPLVQCDDYAIKRRVLLVPFNVLIPDSEQDKQLTDKLIAAELPGILAWGVAGAVDYLANGLCIPDQVRAATDEYRAQMDALHDFWSGLVFGEERAFTTAADLRSALETWAKENGVEERDLPKGAEWGRLLHERGARRDKKKLSGKTVSVWYGVKIDGADEQGELL